MIKPVCEQCEKELPEYGALLISPPPEWYDGTGGTQVDKYHLCRRCYTDLIFLLKDKMTYVRFEAMIEILQQTERMLTSVEEPGQRITLVNDIRKVLK